MNEGDKSLVKSILLSIIVVGAIIFSGLYLLYGKLVIPKVILNDSQIFEYKQKIDNQIQEPVDDYLDKIESTKASGFVVSSGIPLTHLKAEEDFSFVLPTLDQSSVVSWTNNQRSSFGLTALKRNSVLDTVARVKMEEMFRLGYFAHNSPAGNSIGDLAQQYQYQYASIGENLAQGYFSTEIDLVMAWMASPSHRDNILGANYREIGVAVGKGVFNGQETILAVQVFAKPLSSCFLPNSALKEQISTNQIKIKEMENELVIKKTELEQNKFVDQEDRSEAIDTYNQLVKSFNNLIKVTEASVSAYNKEVRDYNYCLNH